MISNKEVNNQFSKHAKEYNNYNIIQQIVSKALVREITLNPKPKRILELGCGSGQVFKNIEFAYNYYKAIDFSKDMCNIHPKCDNLDVACLDFDSKMFKNYIKDEKYDLILSSSALQWSKDLSSIIKVLNNVSNNIDAVLFTSNTFKSIFEITKFISPILDTATIKDAFSKYYNCKFEILNYKLEFDDKKSLFNYIKNSGVSGDNNNLSFKEAKNLYKNYNLNYLEFEVIFIKATKC